MKEVPSVIRMPLVPSAIRRTSLDPPGPETVPALPVAAGLFQKLNPAVKAPGFSQPSSLYSSDTSRRHEDGEGPGLEGIARRAEDGSRVARVVPADPRGAASLPGSPATSGAQAPGHDGYGANKRLRRLVRAVDEVPNPVDLLFVLFAVV